jgi:CBS domain-containing protein
MSPAHRPGGSRLTTDPEGTWSASNRFEEATVMATVRDLMTPGAVCVGVGENLIRAAIKMRDLGVGSLPICGADNKLAGC